MAAVEVWCHKYGLMVFEWITIMISDKSKVAHVLTFHLNNIKRGEYPIALTVNAQSNNG